MRFGRGSHGVKAPPVRGPDAPCSRGRRPANADRPWLRNPQSVSQSAIRIRNPQSVSEIRIDFFSPGRLQGIFLWPGSFAIRKIVKSVLP
jgi:hypothetical protein